MSGFLKERLVIFAIFAAIFAAWQVLRMVGLDIDGVYPLLLALAVWLIFIFRRARNK